jgi:hypothetical protein
MFVNKMDRFYSSMHSMGLFYTKDSEGSVYYNGSSSVTLGDAVPPGECFVYKWCVVRVSHGNLVLLTPHDHVFTGSFRKALVPMSVMTAAFWPTIPTSACIKIRMPAEMGL